MLYRSGMKRIICCLFAISSTVYGQEAEAPFPIAAPPAAAAPIAAPPAAAAPIAAPPAAAAPIMKPRLVGVILSTSQALLWDDLIGEYVLKRVGEELGDARIIALEGHRMIIE